MQRQLQTKVKNALDVNEEGQTTLLQYILTALMVCKLGGL